MKLYKIFWYCIGVFVLLLSGNYIYEIEKKSICTDYYFLYIDIGIFGNTIRLDPVKKGYKKSEEIAENFLYVYKVKEYNTTHYIFKQFDCENT